MFHKRLRLKKATKYRDPKYPVMESGEVLSTPKEMRLGDLAMGLARPIAPIVLSAGLAASGGNGSAAAHDGRPSIVSSIHPGTSASFLTQDRKDEPYPARRFTEREIENLILELNLEYTYPENVRGEPALRMPPLTEAQGAKILERFFAKNGILLRTGIRLQKGDVEFVVDGYDPAKKVGFEFVPVAGENDLSPEEISRIEKGIEGEHLLLVRGESKALPRPQEVIRRLQQTASAYLERLYHDAVLGRAREIERLIGELLSTDAAARDKAAEALRAIGPEALWWLRRKADDERVKPVLQAVYKGHILPLLDGLDDERLQTREESTAKLIEMGPPVLSYVEARLREAAGNSEVETRCGSVLKTIREEHP